MLLSNYLNTKKLSVDKLFQTDQLHVAQSQALTLRVTFCLNINGNRTLFQLNMLMSDLVT